MIGIAPAAELPEVKLLSVARNGDARGFFSETWSRQRFAQHGIDVDFVQDNHSLSRAPNTLRGLHFQIEPFAQAKLVRVVRGAVLDVAVDIRHGSPTFGRHIAAELSADAWNQLFVPVGFAHGFVTLLPDTEVVYKVGNIYSAEHDRGLLWNDPALGIDWGVAAEDVVISDKDRRHPKLADLPRYFAHER